MQDGFNGWTVPAGDIDELASAMRRMSDASPERLGEMSDGSRALAGRLTPKLWARNLHEEIERVRTGVEEMLTEQSAASAEDEALRRELDALREDTRLYVKKRLRKSEKRLDKSIRKIDNRTELLERRIDQRGHMARFDGGWANDASCKHHRPAGGGLHGSFLRFFAGWVPRAAGRCMTW